MWMFCFQIPIYKATASKQNPYESVNNNKNMIFFISTKARMVLMLIVD